MTPVSWRPFIFCLALWLNVSAPSTASPRHNTRRLPAIPSAQGFGIFTPGGSGRHLRTPRTTIFVVRSLADSGSASLRECVDLPVPRVCVFEVAGEIKLTRDIRIRSPYITIAGQTAPQQGITILRGGIKIETHDVVIQHLAIRPGDSPEGSPARERDGISVGAPPPNAAYNVLLDHLSVTWAIDENVSTAYPLTRDVTVSNSLIAEGLYHSIHPKGPHSKGVMVGDDSQRISLFRNVIAFNEERNPYIKPGASCEFINNLVYGWGPRGAWSVCNISNNDSSAKPVTLTFAGNWYMPGPDSYNTPPVYGKDLAPGSRIFVSDTRWGRSPYRHDASVGAISSSATSISVSSPPIISRGSQPLTSSAIPGLVFQNVGSRPRYRSPIDARILSDIKSNRGSLKDCIVGCANSTGGWPTSRGTRRALRIPRYPFADTNRDGYTNLENWLFARAKRVEQR